MTGLMRRSVTSWMKRMIMTDKVSITIKVKQLSKLLKMEIKKKRRKTTDGIKVGHRQN
jgi:ribosomal protein L21